MRVIPTQLLLSFENSIGKLFNTPLPEGAKQNRIIFQTFLFILLSLGNVSAENIPPTEENVTKNCSACDNVVTGGEIQANESGCPAPTWDPSPITSVSLPTGGTGALEYVWIFTTDDPTWPLAQWTPIPNSNGPNYDPGPISVTTHFRRCARREGCIEYIGESNIITKTAICCDNVTDGGQIGVDQHFCGISFNPDPIINVNYPSGGSGDTEYQWLMSLTGTPYFPGSPDWILISGANGESYDLGLIVQNTYFIRLARREGCIDYAGISNIVALTVSPAVNSSIVGTNVTCAGGSDGAINLTATGGTSPFQFLWNPNLGNVEDPQGLTAGNYAVTVTDVEGCSAVASIDLQDGSQVFVTLDGTDETCLGANNGTAQVFAVGGGTPNYTYVWNTSPSQSGSTLGNLAPGTYNITATDAVGCSATSSITILAGPPLDVVLESTNESCLNGSNGSASILEINGGVPGYTYQWNDPLSQTGSVANGLPAGSFTVTVTDSQGCIGTATAVIQSGPPLDVSIQSTDEACMGANNGSAGVVDVNGGIGDFIFQWNDPLWQTSQTVFNLSPGTYTVTVTDSQGCIGTASAAILSGLPLVVSIQSADESCLGANNGSAGVLEVTGGIGDYTFQWNDPLWQTSQFVSNLSAGSYTVTVTDSQGCIGTASAVIENGPALVVTLESNDESCLGANNGSAGVLEITGGIGDFTYQWNDPFAQATQFISGLPVGTYTVTVTDSQGCIGSASVQIDNGPMLDVTTNANEVSCFGGNDGNATVATVSGGSGNYFFQWNDPALQTSQTAINLSPGVYEVIVNDDQGCVGIGSATVEDGIPLILNSSHTNAQCGNTADGTATVSVTGGVAPYTYLWNDPTAQSSPTATGLSAGSYSVTVTDANGCTATASETVQAPMAAIVITSSTDVTCAGANDGSVSVSIQNGDPADFNFLWNDPAASTGTQVSGLPQGTYSVTVSDANGCMTVASAVVFEPPLLVLTMQADSASCANSSDGTASVSVIGGTPFGNGYQYLWSAPGNPTVSVLDDVAPGTYTVTVTDSNGCTAFGSVEIGAPEALTLNVSSTQVTCSGLENGSATVVAAGGTAPYAYLWDNANNNTSPTVNNLGPGVYGVTVTDANGCSAFSQAMVFEPPALNLTISKTDILCVDDNSGTATAQTGGGVAPYSFAWSNGENTESINGLSAGVYQLTVTDGNGCTITGSVSILALTDLASFINYTDASCSNSSNGSATAFGQGGMPPYSFSWSNNATGSTISNLSAGTYSVTVTDANGCTVQNSVQVGAPPQLTCQTQLISPITTYGGSDGMASVSAAGGVAPYTYNWANGSTGSSVTNLSAGVQTVTVTDSNGCTCNSSITLTNPSKIGNFVWNDSNQNGIQDAGETGLASVTVTLFGTTSGGAIVNMSTQTSANGIYNFDGLQTGFYRIEVSLPGNYAYSPHNVGNDALDSDINPVTGSSETFWLASAFYDDKWDAGLVALDEKINIGDFVWEDVDRNGIQGQFEQGIPNTPVKLISMPGNTVIASTLTNASGKYLFTDVLPGTYVVEFSLSNLPNGYVFAPQNQGSDDEKDSDPDPATGRTAPFQVFPFTLDNLSIDAGIFKECDNVTDGGLIGYDEDLCGIGADPAEIVNLALPTGGFGNLEYLWLTSTVPVYNGPGDPNWVMIPNSNSANYNPGPISQTTYYIRCSRRQGCVDYPGETNIVAKKVTPYPLTQIIDWPSELCEFEDGRFEAAIAGAGATYFWEFGPGATPSTASTRVVNAVNWSTSGLKTVKLTVTRLGCSFSTTVNVLINNCGSNLIGFDDILATLNGEKVDITWKVSGDASQTLFFVQRSEDGLAYENLTAVAGVGNQATSSYQFTDFKPRLGNNFYRIKFRQMDGSGFEGFSPVASVFFRPEGVGLVQVYPNPTSGKITIELLKPNEFPASVKITSPFGKMLESLEIPAETEKLELDLSHFSQGVYLVCIKQKGYREQVHRVVKAE